ncbi:MAG: MIP/aquaporin family protein [Chitinophagales bacterium]
MKNNSSQNFPWRIFFSEMLGTGLLLLIGLSIVIVMFGSGSPVEQYVPDIGLRRLITGFLFGSTGALIAISAIGKASGAHINPVVTMGFFLMGKIDGRTSISYILGQFAGAIIGCIPILAWGSMGRSISFGATIPGEGYTLTTVLLGEIITTFTMVILLAIFLAFRTIRPYTPAIFPILYSVMSFLEAAISGTSTNPARSTGPAIISGQWEGWWIYWIGPITGALLAILLAKFLKIRITHARIYHFDS